MNPEISRRAALSLGAAVGVGALLSSTAQAAEEKRRVIIWSEGTEPKETYPDGIRAAVAASLKSLEGWEILTRTLTDPGQGIPEEDLAKTDVLFWWGHKLHPKVTKENIEAINKHVRERGMGYVSLHSSHFAEPYKKLMGTPCSWSHYVDDGSKVDMLVMKPKHPLAKGVGDFVIPKMERYGEAFKCKEPADCVFTGIYTLPDGTKEPSRMMLDWKVGKGKVVYFQPGHETYPIFFQPEVQQLMRNTCQWCAPDRMVTF
ncbi:MAG TPA: ThuA domain-containing protein [Tepidisphaeraceae bacterium]|jgi:trehalose utilization protein